MCSHVSVRLQMREGVKDELEEALNEIQFDDKSVTHCQDHGVRKVTSFESLPCMRERTRRPRSGGNLIFINLRKLINLQF